MKSFKWLISLLFFFQIAHSLFAQPTKIEGIILDINTHRAIPYVNIYVKGAQIGTVSDITGKFSLTIPGPKEGIIIVFQHINYDVREMNLAAITSALELHLQPRVLPLPEVRVEAVGEKLEIQKDIPQVISVIESKSFDVRGYVDAGDLLRTDHSVQVEEQLSGKKTISIRGGNPDDVVVLYNGIKMNSEFNNVFDFSLVDLEDIDRLEVIKGSNTALYGSEAFSGVINIVPKLRQDYSLRFQQRIGTYDSGNYGVHVYQKYRNLLGSYRFRQGGAKRYFSDSDEDQALENNSIHHSANIGYVFSEGPGGIATSTVGATFIQSSLEYVDKRDDEKLTNASQIIGLNFAGDLFRLRNLNLSISQKWLDEDQTISSAAGGLERNIEDHSLQIHAQKTFIFENAELLLGYQYEGAKLDFYDFRTDASWIDMEEASASLQREKHGAISILKVHAPSGSEILKEVDFDLSYRYDAVTDKLNEKSNLNSPYELGEFTGDNWVESMLKFASDFSGYHNDYAFNIFMNYGRNVKFPTLSQLISSQLAITSTIIQPDLNPEKNQSMEIGLNLKRDLSSHPTIYGWEISGNFMKNYYENKIVAYFTPGIPVAFYDMVPDARISGFETRTRVFFLKKKVTLEFGYSRYSIPEKSAFPFKYDMKRTVNFMIDHAGYSFQIHWFKEGEQIGLIRQFSGYFDQTTLPEFSSIDIHLSKTFSFGKFKIFGNFSGRNLTNDKVELEGLALRDRRIYFTIGAQY